MQKNNMKESPKLFYLLVLFFALLAMLFWSLTVKVKPLRSVCSGVAVSNDTKYHAFAILLVLVK